LQLAAFGARYSGEMKDASRLRVAAAASLLLRNNTPTNVQRKSAKVDIVPVRSTGVTRSFI